MFKGLKETMSKELKEVTMTQKGGISIEKQKP